MRRSRRSTLSRFQPCSPRHRQAQGIGSGKRLLVLEDMFDQGARGPWRTWKVVPAVAGFSALRHDGVEVFCRERAPGQSSQPTWPVEPVALLRGVVSSEVTELPGGAAIPIRASASTASAIRPARHAAEHPRCSQTCPPPSPTGNRSSFGRSASPQTRHVLGMRGPGAVQPLGDAAVEGKRLGLRPGQPAVVFGDRCPLVVVGLPVLRAAQSGAGCRRATASCPLP